MAGILWPAHGKVEWAMDRQVERVVWKKRAVPILSRYGYKNPGLESRDFEGCEVLAGVAVSM
ncbi:hypothetical protein PCI56_19340 [Plesiomonas shigelloides subsp. oncorhynchi]|nr:hypothetical protein [Plesiomonas shigelloides]